MNTIKKVFAQKNINTIFEKKLAKVLVNNSFMNEKTYGSPSNNIKIHISLTLETGTTHATEYNKKRVCTEKYKYQQYIYR